MVDALGVPLSGDERAAYYEGFAYQRIGGMHVVSSVGEDGDGSSRVHVDSKPAFFQFSAGRWHWVDERYPVNSFPLPFASVVAVRLDERYPFLLLMTDMGKSAKAVTRVSDVITESVDFNARWMALAWAEVLQ